MSKRSSLRRPATLARSGRTALLALTFSLGTAVPISCALAKDLAGAVFTMTNSAIGYNQIVAYGRQEDGSLSLTYVVPTGGLGSGPAPTSTVFGTPVPVTADGLGSQGSLILSADRRLLLAANAGSDSISCLRVDTKDLRARTVSSGGVFPVSLTFRARPGGAGGVLYVLNAGG
jgi:6-phosphogluconolactonase